MAEVIIKDGIEGVEALEKLIVDLVEKDNEV